MKTERINGIVIDTENLDFNEMLNMTFFDDLPASWKEYISKSEAFKIDDMGFVRDADGKDVTYDQLKELIEGESSQ
jgi:hypothetical protein